MTIHKQETINNRKLQIVFFAALLIVVFGGLLWVINKAKQFRQTTYQSIQRTNPVPTIIQNSTMNWHAYQNPSLGFSFKYPTEILKLSEEIHTSGNLITKLMLTPIKGNTTSITILIWKSPKTSLTKNTIETWCKNTLRSEAAQQQVLCALLSPPAITETTIFGKTLYRTKYYSSFNDQTDFFIIQQGKNVFTVQVVTPNETQPQTPLLLQILSTFKFTN